MICECCKNEIEENNSKRPKRLCENCAVYTKNLRKRICYYKKRVEQVANGTGMTKQRSRQ